MLRSTIIFFFLSSFFNSGFSQENVVKIAFTESKWQLTVDGSPYYIKGAGGENHLDELVAAGGNTIRTWGIENAQSVLDEAQKRGIKVMLGLWVQHERHGFDYNDETKVANQLEAFRSQIRKYKNHPALLIWCVGNEYELDYQNVKVWKAVNDIAKMIHEEDQNHPTSTVTAGTNADKLAHVMTELPDVDIYGINTYGDIGNVKKVLTNGGFNGPYMITEWGPNGHWESPKTNWGTSIEQTSKEKFDSYKLRYSQYIKSDSAYCIGSFAFLWGQKQEYTSTWYGIFSENGDPTEVYDALAQSWSNVPLKNSSPTLDSVSVFGFTNKLNLVFKSDQEIEFTVFSKDANGDKLTYYWEMFPESEDLKTGGDAESKPLEVVGSLKNRRSAICKLKVPDLEGRYRIYITVSDGEKIAYANLPFYVQPLSEEESQKSVRLIKTDLKSFENE